jgi:hypothetical protein
MLVTDMAEAGPTGLWIAAGWRRQRWSFSSARAIWWRVMTIGTSPPVVLRLSDPVRAVCVSALR